MRLQLLPVVTIAIALSYSPQARSGGFEAPGIGAKAAARGGAFAVLANDLTALMLNPGGLSRLQGTQLLLNHNTAINPVTFTRHPSMVPTNIDTLPDDIDPFGPSENKTPVFALGAALAIASDFGLEDWTFAFGVHGPNAIGTREFDPNGGQRYMLTRTEVLLVQYALAVAYGHKDKFGFGLALKYYDIPLSKLSLAIDGTSNPQQFPYYSNSDVISTLDMTTTKPHFGANLGAWWRPMKELELGISSRIVPVKLQLSGDVTLGNTPQSQHTAESLVVKNGKSALDLTYPMNIRTGIRYRHTPNGNKELFDIELNFVWENWSVLKEYDVDLSGFAVLYNKELPGINLPKNWQDTYSVRLGGTYHAIEDKFAVSAGTFWESAAAPNQTSNLDYMPFDRIGAGTGIHLTGWGMDFTLAYLFTQQLDRDVSESESKVIKQRPIAPCPDGCNGFDGVPANAGKFESSIHQVQVGLTLHFDQWFN